MYVKTKRLENEDYFFRFPWNVVLQTKCIRRFRICSHIDHSICDWNRLNKHRAFMYSYVKVRLVQLIGAHCDAVRVWIIDRINNANGAAALLATERVCHAFDHCNDTLSNAMCRRQPVTSRTGFPTAHCYDRIAYSLTPVSFVCRLSPSWQE